MLHFEVTDLERTLSRPLPMKIALVHMRHAETGGTERYQNQLAKHLAERGDQVTLVCRTHEEPPHPAVRFATLRPLALGAAWRLRAFASAVEEHVRASEYDLVYGLGKTWSQDVLRLGGGSHASYLELAHAATLSRGKRFFGGGVLKHSLALKIEQRAFHAPELARIVVNARMVQEDVMRRYELPAERFRLVYNGVDLERFHPRLAATSGAALRRECGFRPEHTVVLFLGSGYGRMGLDVVLDAFPALLRTRPNARLLVVGYDSAQPEFERRASALGIADNARFLGGRRDVENCFAAADVYALPTRYDPFANTTLEALASGLAVVTTRGNGAHELIQEHEQGSILASSDDAAALTRELAYWCEPKVLAPARSTTRALAERHSAASKVRESAAVLDEVLAQKRGRRERLG